MIFDRIDRHSGLLKGANSTRPAKNLAISRSTDKTPESASSDARLSARIARFSSLADSMPFKIGHGLALKRQSSSNSSKRGTTIGPIRSAKRGRNPDSLSCSAPVGFFPIISLSRLKADCTFLGLPITASNSAFTASRIAAIEISDPSEIG